MKMKDFLETFSTISPRKKGSWSWRKLKSVFFFFTCTVFKVGAVTTCSGNAFHGEITLDEKRFLGFLSYKMFSSI